jgi:iron complex outermembrane receptor protein
MACGGSFNGSCWRAWFGLTLALLPAAAFADDAGPTVSPLVVVAPTPLAGTGVDRDKLPSSTDVLEAADLQRRGSLSITDVLAQRTPGISLSDSQGNGLARALDYRGFTASPLQGAPQGLAVYMGAVRLNEAFGDTVNWDLIPQVAIRRIELVSGDPAFGLNALGGALSLAMNTGRDLTGSAVSLQGGSFGQASGSAQYGAAKGPWSAYVALDAGHEDGWRQHSPSNVARAYANLGWSEGRGELQLTANLGETSLGVVGPTPVDMLAADRTSAFTFPQTTRNRTGLLALSGSLKASDAWTLQGNLYARAFSQDHVDGNDGDFEGCSRSPTDPLFGALCVQGDDFPAAIRPAAAAFQVLGADGAPIGCPPLVAGETKLCNGIPYGAIDRTHTRTEITGISAQAVREATLLGRPNLFAAGLSLEASTVRFSADSTLGLIFPDLSVQTNPGMVVGAGQVIHTAGAIAYSPVDLHASTQNTGLYATDTVDITRTLFLTLSGRWNGQQITTSDRTGVAPDLNGRHHFDRFNPAVGLAWKMAAWITGYGGYSETNRAPTPLELSCSNPLKPCLLENALVSDPPLNQVVSKTWQAGVRGGVALLDGSLNWRLSAYRSDNRNDIVALASALQGRGSYANVPGTRREGFEAEADLRAEPWMAYASLSEVEATYRFSGALPSPNSPFADDNGNVAVTSGDRIGGIPPWRFKAGGEYNLTPAITVGADVLGVGKQRRVGDESNQDEQMPGYWVTGIHAAWDVSHGVQLFGRVDNLFDRKYATFGTYFQTSSLDNLNPSPLPGDPSPNTDTPAPPRSFLVGLRVRW